MLVALVAVVVPAGVAAAAPTPTCTWNGSSWHCAVTFDSAGNWSVPTGVASVSVTADGAAGGGATEGQVFVAGGPGSSLTATLTAIPSGTTLAISPGGEGANGTFNEGGPGGLGGGGNGGNGLGGAPSGGGGGGETIVAVNGKPLVVAGGGGGTGGADSNNVTTTGGTGGATGTAANGRDESTIFGGDSGKGGAGGVNGSTGGAGAPSLCPSGSGSGSGTAGAPNAGGAGGSYPSHCSIGGGGGGAGYEGGGGGGAGDEGGGGGGGSNYLPTSSVDGISVTQVGTPGTNAAAGKVVINYALASVGTTTSLKSAANPSAFGQGVTFGATVTSALSGAGVVSGVVTFKFGTATLCGDVAVSGGTASCQTNMLPLGGDTVTATFTSTAGYSGSSATVVQQVAPTVPSAPRTLTATAGNTQVALEWSAPSSNGGSAITGYDVYVGTSAGGESTTAVNSAPLAATATSYTAAGLTNGITYYFTVEAINAVGASPASNEAPATPITVPSAPTGLTATGGNASALLAWTAPASDGGGAITGYNVFEGTTAGGESTTPVNPAPLAANATSYPASGLTNGTGYFFTVKAINADGSSPASNEASATPATVPSAPTGLTAAPGAGRVSLAWTAPTSNGGDPVTGYRVFRSLNAGGEGTVPLATTTSLDYVDTTATAGTTYFYTVEAVNAAGSSAPSNEASAQVEPIPAGGSRLAATPDGTGWWVLNTNGSVSTYGNATNYGSTVSQGLHLNAPPVGIAATPDGHGYWIVAADGGIFSYGDAAFYGSAGNIHLNQPVVGMTATPDGHGYWIVAADGGIFSYGDAAFYGSAGNIHLYQPIVGVTRTPDGHGYWLVATDGGIFTYGDAGFYGSAGGIHLNQPIVGVTRTPDGHGYWLVATDGGIFTYGDAHFYGSSGASPATSPTVGLIANPSGSGYTIINTAGTPTRYGT